MDSPRSLPNILLIGAGRFGKNHLRVLQNLKREGKLALIGVVVQSSSSAEELRAAYRVPVFLKLTDRLLRQADAVVIATPIHTHVPIVKRCLRFAHVLCEKPLALRAKDAKRLEALARKNKRILMVGHIFRFHPLFFALQKALPPKKDLKHITGEFISPAASDRGEPATLEELHLFDILDALFGETPTALWSEERKRITETSLRYASCDALLHIGWEGEEKRRSLSFTLRNGTTLVADFARGALQTVSRAGKKTTREIRGEEPLVSELRCFLDLVSGERKPYPDGKVGTRIVSIAERLLPSPRKLRVAIIGGGIFGATAALVLSKRFKVTLFERHDDIMTEASYGNQYRHHAGFHYPRSAETIRQIQESSRDFEAFYRGAIRRVRSFYAIAKSGSKTTPEAFRRLCSAHHLRCKRAYPPPQFLDPESVSVSYKTDEAVYDYAKLRSEMRGRMKRAKNLSLRFGAAVTGARILQGGEKELSFQSGTPLRFDVLINTTYANYNTVLSWLRIPPRDLEYRFKELALVLIKGEKPCAVTVMDGPFATLVPTGTKDIYTLGDVPLSVHRKSRSFSDATFSAWKQSAALRGPRMLKRCARWFPVLSKARYHSSICVTLPIDISSRASDDRPTSLSLHGFGCYSVLEGKIITSVTVAKKLLAALSSFEKTGKKV